MMRYNCHRTSNYWFWGGMDNPDGWWIKDDTFLLVRVIFEAIFINQNYKKFHDTNNLHMFAHFFKPFGGWQVNSIGSQMQFSYLYPTAEKRYPYLVRDTWGGISGDYFIFCHVLLSGFPFLLWFYQLYIANFGFYKQMKPHVKKWGHEGFRNVMGDRKNWMKGFYLIGWPFMLMPGWFNVYQFLIHCFCISWFMDEYPYSGHYYGKDDLFYKGILSILLYFFVIIVIMYLFSATPNISYYHYSYHFILKFFRISAFFSAMFLLYVFLQKCYYFYISFIKVALVWVFKYYDNQLIDYMQNVLIYEQTHKQIPLIKHLWRLLLFILREIAFFLREFLIYSLAIILGIIAGSFAFIFYYFWYFMIIFVYKILSFIERIIGLTLSYIYWFTLYFSSLIISFILYENYKYDIYDFFYEKLNIIHNFITIDVYNFFKYELYNYLLFEVYEYLSIHRNATIIISILTFIHLYFNTTLLTIKTFILVISTIFNFFASIIQFFIELFLKYLRKIIKVYVFIVTMICYNYVRLFNLKNLYFITYHAIAFPTSFLYYVIFRKIYDFIKHKIVFAYIDYRREKRKRFILY